MERRQVLLAALSWPLLLPLRGLAQGAPRTTGAETARFDDGTVPALARTLAARPYRPPEGELAPALQRLGYDEYRDIRFDPRRALWREARLPFQAQFFHRGFLFRDRVEMHDVHAGQATPIVYTPGMFTFGAAPRPTSDGLGFAGVRLHAPINKADYFDEVCAFLGASYFRAVARGQAYGLSARGLALGTADPAGEEFPRFTAFWLERPDAGARNVVVHALLDSPSTSGAFRFTITPGVETLMDVQARLYPRRTLERAGIAPLTSMFHFASNDRVGIDDYRPAVHDSDGLALWNGNDEQAWRPLQSPSRLQESAFADPRPRAYGLMQRRRDHADYADSEARYEDRPSLWVEPRGDWGAGAVHLVEIPTGDEFHDNIVAAWRPRQPLAAGREHRFDYRLHWCDDHAWKPSLARVARTRVGAGSTPGARRFVIDLAGGGLAGTEAEGALQPDVSATPGKVVNVVAHPNPQAQGWRMAFELQPGREPVVELRAVLRDGGRAVSETWLYRWTA